MNSVDMLRTKSGFTIIELIIVMAIISIIGAIYVTSFVGNPRSAQIVAEAEALRANLRYTQAKAMTDLPGNLWSLNISSGSYTIQQNGATPNPAVNLPGSNSGTYTLPSGITVTAGTGQVRFNFRGQPVDSSGNALTSNTTVTFAGSQSITITQNTGFIP